MYQGMKIRYAEDCRALSEDETYAWLKETFDARFEDLEEFIDFTAGFNPRFVDIKKADPNDANQPR